MFSGVEKGCNVNEWVNASKLHFNKRGTQGLSNWFAEATSNIINLQSVLHSLANNDSFNSAHSTDENKENKALREVK